jgi:chromosome partitioning protein
MDALQGVDSLLNAVKVMTEYTNKGLRMLGAVVTMFDSRTTAGKVMLEGIRSYFGNKRVFQTTIHRNTAVNKANMLFKCACDFDPKSAGCQDYRDFAKEIIQRIEHWSDFA